MNRLTNAPPSRERIEATVVAVVAIVVALTIVVTTVVAVFRGYSPVPYYDQWDEVTIAEHLSHFWAQHNEHRIVLPRIVFIIDKALFNGSNVFNLVVILALQGAQAVLLLCFARRLGLTRHLGFYLVASALVGTAFSGYQWENFVWGFQVGFAAVFVFATASFLAMSSEGPEGPRLAISSLFGALAMFTMANGVLVLFVLIPLAVLLRFSRRSVALLMALAGASIIVYLIGYETPPHHADPIGSLYALPEILAYVLVYLGGPPAAFLSTALRPACWRCGNVLELSRLFGGLAIVLMLGVSRNTWVANEKRDAKLGLLGVCTFVIATAFITGLGRQEFGLDQALASRYGTPALIFWASLLLLGFGVDYARDAVARPRRSALIALALLLMVALGQRNALDNAWQRGQLSRRMGVAILSGAVDPELSKWISPRPESIVTKSALLRENSSSVFATEESKWLNQRLDRLFPLTDHTECIGAFESGSRLGGSHVRVSGWAWSRVDGSPPKHIVVVDRAGVVTGIAAMGFSRPDITDTMPEVASVNSGWIGYSSLSSQGSLAGFALVGHPRKACLVGSWKAGAATP